MDSDISGKVGEMMMIHDLFTNGNASRKFALVVFALMLLTMITIACAWSTGIASVLAIFVGGLTGLVGVYVSGNVLAKKYRDGRKEKE